MRAVMYISASHLVEHFECPNSVVFHTYSGECTPALPLVTIDSSRQVSWQLKSVVAGSRCVASSYALPSHWSLNGRALYPHSLGEDRSDDARRKISFPSIFWPDQWFDMSGHLPL